MWSINCFALMFIAVDSKTLKSLKVLLTKPRLFYTHMYSRKQTTFLALFWITITAIECLVFFNEWEKAGVLKGHTTAQKLLIIWFQTVSVRGSGFNNVNIRQLSTGHLALYVLTMYISSYPVAVSIRTSLVGSGKKSYVKQARRLLSRDLIWLYLSVVLITFIEELSGKEFFK